MSLHGQSVVVTGACGFIGSHLVEALVRRGAHVKALTFYNARGSHGWMDNVAADVRKDVQIVSGDIRDAGMMRDLIAKADTVFHLAALIGIPYSYQAPASYVETNVTGTLNILEACRSTGAARLLVTSTSEVYGTALRVPIDEAHPLQAQSPYSATKIAAEKLAESYHKSFETPLVIIRPFNTFGPRQSARAVIPTILMQLLHGQQELKLGDTATSRDFNYVADTVEGMIRLAECDAAIGRTVNIGTGKDFTIADIAAMAQNIAGVKVIIRQESSRTRPVASEVRRLCCDNTLLKSLTGWAPPVRVEEGLKLMADWMKKEMEFYDPQRYYV